MSLELKESVEDLTKCSKCSGEVVSPKSLPCLHTFCLQCIKDHCKDNSTGNRVNCPVCRSSFVIPDDGIEQLPDNFFVKGLADAKKVSERPSEIISCDGCSDQRDEEASSTKPATAYCTGCGQNLCENCSKPHRRFPGVGHEVIPFGTNLLVEAMLSQGCFCGQHPGSKFEIYCIECNKNMCVVCCHGNKHREHYLQERLINEVYVEFQKTIERDIQIVLDKEKSIQQIAEVSKREQQQINDEMVYKEAELSRISEEIKRKVDEAVCQLTERLSDEKIEVSKVADAINHEFEIELAAFCSFMKHSRGLVKEGKPWDITHAYIELHSRAGELMQREMNTHDYQLPARSVSSRDLFDEIFDFVSVNSTKYQAQNERNASELRQLEKEKDEVEQRLEKLTVDHVTKLEQLKAEKDDIGKERDAARDQVSKLTAEKKQLEKDKDDNEKERVTMKDRLSKLINEREQLEKDKNDIREEKDTLKEQLFKLTADNKRLEKDKEDIGRERDTVMDQASKLIAEKTQLEEVRDAITEEREYAKDQISKLTVEKEHLQRDKVEIGRERDTVKGELSKLTAEKKQLEKDKDDIRKEKDTVKNQLFKLTAEKRQLERDKDAIGKERDTVKNQLITLEAHKKQLEEDKADLTTKTETYEKQDRALLYSRPDKGIESEEQMIFLGGYPAKNWSPTSVSLCVQCVVNLVHQTKEDKAINGVTSLNDEVYVRHGDTDIRVYDSETYTVQRTLQVPRLGGVSDMTSCKRHQYIYISDQVNKVVHRVDNKNTITQWPVNDEPHGLSVNSVHNVLVTCNVVGKVKEFTTDGKLVREINLDSSIVNPGHAVELTTDQLVVCHGGANDTVHRICIVDLAGRVLQSYGGSKGSGSGQMNLPIRLAVSAGVLFVVDCRNHRVLMLSSTLNLIRAVVSGLRDPCKIWFDDEKGRLHVADNKWENSSWAGSQFVGGRFVSGKLIVYGV